MADHKPAQADPKQIEHAQEMWGNFLRLSKYAIATTAVVLAAMALVFIR